MGRSLASRAASGQGHRRHPGHCQTRPSVAHAALLLTLRDSGVKFLAVDMSNDLAVGILALVVQAEREAISRRTKDALAVARAAVKLGNPNGAAAFGRAGTGGAAPRARRNHIG